MYIRCQICSIYIYYWSLFEEKNEKYRVIYMSDDTTLPCVHGGVFF